MPLIHKGKLDSDIVDLSRQQADKRFDIAKGDGEEKRESGFKDLKAF